MANSDGSSTPNLSRPFTLREAGLLGDRPFWRSRLGILLVLIGVSLCLESGLLIWRASLWGEVPMRSIPRAILQARAMESTALQVLTLIAQAVWCLVIVLPLWFSARAWTHDTDPSNREQIAVLPIRRGDFRFSRFHLWFAIFVLSHLLALTLGSGILRLAESSGDDLSLLHFADHLQQGRNSPVLNSLLPLTWFGSLFQMGVGSLPTLDVIVLVLFWSIALFTWVALLAPHAGAPLAVTLTVMVGIVIPAPPLLLEKWIWPTFALLRDDAAAVWLIAFEISGVLAVGLIERRLRLLHFPRDDRSLHPWRGVRISWTGRRT